MATEPRPADPDAADTLGMAFLAFFAGFIGSGILGGLLGADEESAIALRMVATVPLWLALGGGAVLIHQRKGRDPVAELRLAIRPLDALALPVGAALQLLVGLLYRPFVDLDELEKPAQELADRATGAAGVVVFVVMTCVIAPVVEEIFYRGLVFETLRKVTRTAIAVVVSGVIFGAIHLQPLQFPGLALVGIACALAVVCTGRLGTAILLHAGFNLVAVLTLKL